jgi:hypothetical protein
MEAVTPNPAIERTSSKQACARFARPLIVNDDLSRESELTHAERRPGCVNGEYLLKPNG